MLTKIDRLVVELKLPPGDAYHKLRHTIDEVNALIRTHYGDDSHTVSVVRVLGDLCLKCTHYGADSHTVTEHTCGRGCVYVWQCWWLADALRRTHYGGDSHTVREHACGRVRVYLWR